MIATAAWTVWDATIYDGPGKTYDELGTVPGAIKIRVDRCSGYWCQFRGGGKNGWIALADISFGTGPDAPLSSPRLDYPPGGADACFYTGAGYTGTAFCLPPGHVARDAKLWGKDNVISSIMLMEGAKVKVCRDRNFKSWCQLITESEQSLPGFLNDSISSWQIYN